MVDKKLAFESRSEQANADLLRVARQLRGMQQGEAASRLRVSQAVLSRMENRLAGIPSDLLDRMAAVYELPKSFFLQTDPVLGAPVSVHPMWRRKSTVSAREMDQIIAELNIRLMHLRRLLQAVDVEATHSIPSLPVEEFKGDIERIAAMVRSQWQMPPGPVQNLTRVLESAGVIVVHSAMAGSAVDGVTFSAAGLPPLVLLNSDQPTDRMRFTLAHELAHLVMHRTQPTREMEQEAHQFASFFLLPTRDIKPHFTRRIDLRLLAELKPVWRVSMASLLMKAKSMNLLAYNQERYLWQQFSSNNIRLREPPELDFQIEAPTVLTDLFKAHIDELRYSISDLSSMLHMQPKELSYLYGIGRPFNPKANLRIVK